MGYEGLKFLGEVDASLTHKLENIYWVSDLLTFFFFYRLIVALREFQEFTEYI
jgi:hypothetical protein